MFQGGCDQSVGLPPPGIQNAIIYQYKNKESFEEVLKFHSNCCQGYLMKETLNIPQKLGKVTMECEYSLQALISSFNHII